MDERDEGVIKDAAGRATRDSVESGSEIGKRCGVSARQGRHWTNGHQSNPTFYADSWLWRVDDPWRILAHWRSVVYQRHVESKSTQWLVENWWELSKNECDHDSVEDWHTLNGPDGYEEAVVDEREGKIHLQRSAYRRELAKRGVNPRDHRHSTNGTGR